MRDTIQSACLALVATIMLATAAPAQSRDAGRDAAGPFPRNEITTQPFIAPSGGRAELMKTVDALQRSLTALQQLQLQVRQATWTVSGTLFHPLRSMLREHYAGIERAVDRCAERLLAIGASADGRITTIVRTPGLPEIPGGFLDDAQVLSWFTLAYKTVGEDLKRAVRETIEADPATAGLLAEIERGIGQYQWDMRAEFQSTATDPNSGSDLNNGMPVPPPAK